MKQLLQQSQVNELLGVKACTICHEVKSLDQFYKRKQMKDGHRSECKVCNDAKRYARKHKVVETEQHKVEYQIIQEDALKEAGIGEIVTGIIVGLIIVGILYLSLSGGV